MIASPITVLKNHVFPSLLCVAPEKKSELITEIKNGNIEFHFVLHECRILFTADSANKIIRVGEKCLERLWAISYAYFVLYEAMALAIHENDSIIEIEIAGDPTLESAGQLLSWATSVDWQVRVEGDHLESPLPEWPPALPRPVESPQECSNEDIADKLFLSAVGFILHHELAHVLLNHTKSEGIESILNEKDADRAAANWLLEGWDETDKEFTQRIFGIAVALIWLASLDAYTLHSSDSHPPGYDRLYQTLSSSISNECHPVWGFVSTSLLLHLNASGATFDSARVHESAQDAVNYYCDVLSNRF